jgi:hypothetical protein
VARSICKQKREEAREKNDVRGGLFYASVTTVVRDPSGTEVEGGLE